MSKYTVSFRVNYLETHEFSCSIEGGEDVDAVIEEFDTDGEPEWKSSDFDFATYTVDFEDDSGEVVEIAEGHVSDGREVKEIAAAAIRVHRAARVAKKSKPKKKVLA